MQRRHILGGIASALVLPLMAHLPSLAQGTPEALPTDHTIGDAVDEAAVMFHWPDEDGIRSVMARVSHWPDAASAAAFHEQVLHSGGSDLPDGEFYQSDVTSHELDPAPDGVSAGMVGWTTTVGVAAYHTGYALLSVQQDILLWDVVITASSEAASVALGEDLAHRLIEIAPPPCTALADSLPTEDDMPPGATVEAYEYTRITPGQDTERALNLPAVPISPAEDAGCGTPS